MTKRTSEKPSLSRSPSSVLGSEAIPSLSLGDKLPCSTLGASLGMDLFKGSGMSNKCPSTMRSQAKPSWLPPLALSWVTLRSTSTCPDSAQARALLTLGVGILDTRPYLRTL